MASHGRGARLHGSYVNRVEQLVVVVRLGRAHVPEHGQGRVKAGFGLADRVASDVLAWCGRAGGREAREGAQGGPVQGCREEAAHVSFHSMSSGMGAMHSNSISNCVGGTRRR